MAVTDTLAEISTEAELRELVGTPAPRVITKERTRLHERDIEWLDACDVLVADASGSSYGVGFEVGYVLGRSERSHQQVVLLYRTERQPFISRLVCGNSHPRCTTIAYANGAELAATVPNHLAPKA